jgi:hypothetical protein
MPMDFPDMRSLERAADVWKFRKANDGETEAEYRVALADHVQPHDYIESLEIRNKVGWDKFSPEQNKDMLRRRGINL